MKKQYEAPEAKKVEFDYEENVVASGEKWNNEQPAPVGTRCSFPCRKCNQTSNSPF